MSSRLGIKVLLWIMVVKVNYLNLIQTDGSIVWLKKRVKIKRRVKKQISRSKNNGGDRKKMGFGND